MFNIVEIIPSDQLSKPELILTTKEKETEYIKRHRPAFNIISAPWGNDGQISIHKNPNRAHLKGVPRSPKTRRLRAEALCGRPLSVPTRKAIAAAKWSPVLVLNLTDQTEKSYCSYRQLSDELKISYKTINKYIDIDVIYIAKFTKIQKKFILQKKMRSN